MRLQTSKFHFVGIGGIGMCGLAEILHNMGAQVTGSDLSLNANVEYLQSLGIKTYLGHKAENTNGAEVVVFSSAVQRDNPEIVEARRQRIPLIPRAEALAEIMRLKRGIAIAGTHGKTTTTSLVASVFLKGQLQPTIVVGGRLDLIKSTALLGLGEWLIAEADESDGSFKLLSPEIAVITNIDNDHMEHFKNFANLRQAFLDFASRIPFYGRLIYCGDDPVLKDLFRDFAKPTWSYGFNNDNDYVLEGGNGSYHLRGTKYQGDFKLMMPGIHNALNASAAILCGLAAGLDWSVCESGLLQFAGVDRRFHKKGEKNGVIVYDDYGHHPTEVRAVLQAFREKYPKQRLVILFQPHRFTRTESCWQDFTQCFAVADEVLITDIYSAGEKPITGISAVRLAEELVHPNAKYLAKTSWSDIASNLKAGDVFVTLGAGDVWKAGMDLLK